LEKGLVIKSTGSWYTVKKDDGNLLDCKIKGTFRLQGTRTTNPVAVGDHVKIDAESRGDYGVIKEILPRKNYIIRKSSNLSRQYQIIAANIDQALLVITLTSPETPFRFIDRFLASAEAYRIPVNLIINKIDLYDAGMRKEVTQLKEMYEQIGYPCLETSVVKGKNIGPFRQLLKDKVNVISGKSGVGKSSLINAVDPELQIKTEDVSTYHKTGKHTTAYAEMHPLVFGGYVIDTPGIKGFGVIDMDREEIYHFFPEIFRFSRDCQYYNCLHTNEPNCAVIKALESGKISPSRYKSYRSLLDDQDKKYRR
jgi:ribosome biogenesis GTPase